MVPMRDVVIVGSVVVPDPWEAERGGKKQRDLPRGTGRVSPPSLCHPLSLSPTN